jgi:hypothetical protein
MVVVAPGSNIVPLFSETYDSELAAEAGAWLRRYLRPHIRNGRLEDEEARALGDWLSATSGMMSGVKNVNQLLEARAEASTRSAAAVKRTFWRRVAKATRTIKAGLARDGVYVRFAPTTIADEGGMDSNRLAEVAACACA